MAPRPGCKRPHRFRRSCATESVNTADPFHAQAWCGCIAGLSGNSIGNRCAAARAAPHELEIAGGVGCRRARRHPLEVTGRISACDNGAIGAAGFAFDRLGEQW